MFSHTDVSHYYTPEVFERIHETATQHETPCVVFDIPSMEKAYDNLKAAFPYASVYYAIKANPDIKILQALQQRGSSFDIASTYELDKILLTGVDPAQLSYGNTIKKPSWIKYFYDKGVNLFSTDSEADVRALAANAPGSRIYVRVLVDGNGDCDWPLTRKFGCHSQKAIKLLCYAAELGLTPYGVSFHVGSQQKDITMWDTSIKLTKMIFDTVKSTSGIELKLINMGGGFPAKYIQKISEIEVYANQITEYLTKHFGANIPEVILEPGRSLVADAGVLVSEVVLVSQKEECANSDRWVYVDVGKFSGLAETMDESIKYPLHAQKHDASLADKISPSGGFTGELGSAIIAGPTCDSSDVMYENYKYGLPSDLSCGDRIFWISAGAYTTSYSSIEFNGFPPLKCVFTNTDTITNEIKENVCELNVMTQAQLPVEA